MYVFTAQLEEQMYINTLIEKLCQGTCSYMCIVYCSYLMYVLALTKSTSLRQKVDLIEKPRYL